MLSAQDARVITQAAIVRTLKAASKLGHAELVASVQSAVAPRLGTPGVALIKEAVEYLIDKEYIARHATEREVYVYVP